MRLFDLLTKGLVPIRANLYDYEGRPITSIAPKQIKFSHNVSDIEVVDWKGRGDKEVDIRLYCLRQEKPKMEYCSISENPCTWRDLIREQSYERKWRAKQNENEDL